ncbi:SDR family oxidoreductase [Bradyrhizobium sp. Gha]|uniref:SDR family NAD(P)-dependent oxidoreductase n=1 Tax=Bradyrhizobium sp. Gha TaxID=1855318 RepID=UPI0008EB87F7|nr:SDR family oxidoreductase [Bradyrhizobium sp. Gha]SFI94521.1 NAD(P)-dependent dehydrogenase, short-chain alcohol dehydrogenase family [Bradyrhizobium sp. Gha]
MSKLLEGKVALVTGGSRGLGAATALLLAERGAHVAISYVNSSEKADAIVRQITDKGVRSIAFKADQADPAAASGLIGSVVEEFGRLDILVNNAALAIPGKVDDVGADVSALDRQFAVNVTGVIATIRAASQVMRDGGRIITVGSGVAVRTGRPGTADYAATKGAILAYCRGAARDLGSRGITVNMIHAGLMETDMTAPFAAVLPTIVAQLPISRIGKPEEIAEGIAFFAGPNTGYITGAVLNIDGGHSA